LSDAYDEMGRFDAWRNWTEPLVSFRSVVARGGATAQLARHQVSIWESALDHLPDLGAALVISHAGMVECALVSLPLDEDVADWGDVFWNLEGARLGHDGTWHLVSLLRLTHEQRTRTT
jgi:hypothetical protein